MKYRTLGRTELRCSEIGLGTWAFASQVYGAVAESDAINAIRAAEATNLIRDLGKEKVGIVARESLANGFLSGAITKDTQFPPDHLNARYSREEIIARVEQVQRLGFLVRADIKNMPQAAMRWVLGNPHVSLVLSGAKNQREILECAAASEVKPYAPDEMQKAEALHQKDFQAA